MSARVVIALAGALAACSKDKTTGAPAPAPASAIDARPAEPPLPREVTTSTIKVDLPQVPSFDLPAPEPGFTTTIAELRRHGHRFLGQQVKVKGYVTWVYDCVDDIAQPGQDRAAVQKLIDADPARCQRPQLRLGPTPAASERDELWVVEVPRPPRAAERAALSKDDLAAWPAVPVFAVGDQVAVSGTWAARSPHGFASSAGLLVYGSLERVSP